MATKNFVPRADNEGSIGTALKRWAAVYAASFIGDGSQLTGLTAIQAGLGNVDNLKQLPFSYLDIDGTLAANSDAKVPSQKAVKTYIDTGLASKEPTLTKGALTGTNITVTGGTGAVIGGGVAISIPQSVATSAVPTFAGLVCPAIKPVSDSVSAVQIQNAAGANVLNIDTTNGRIGVMTATPAAKVEVSKGLAGSEFVAMQVTDTTSGNTCKTGVLRNAGNTSSFGGIWMNQATPDLTNYSFLASGTDSVFNSPSNIYLRIGNANVARVTANKGLSLGSTFYATDPGANNVIFEGKLGIATSAPSVALDINSNLFRLRTAKTPANAGDTGDVGSFCWDGTYLYICVATNTWRRIAHATW